MEVTKTQVPPGPRCVCYKETEGSCPAFALKPWSSMESSGWTDRQTGECVGRDPAEAAHFTLPMSPLG